MINDYHFISRWRVDGTCGEVADILGDPLALTRWWPSVYLKVDELRPPDARGLGRRVRLETAGWLPYTIRWEFEVVESRYPYGFLIVASGDFDGRGEWTFVQDGPAVDITYDWRLRAEKPLLRNLSFLLKPLFEANHRWAMARGEESLSWSSHAGARHRTRCGRRSRRRRARSPMRVRRSLSAQRRSVRGWSICCAARDAARGRERSYDRPIVIFRAAT